jgi:hypothetical protein
MSGIYISRKDKTDIILQYNDVSCNYCIGVFILFHTMLYDSVSYSLSVGVNIVRQIWVLLVVPGRKVFYSSDEVVL